MTRDQLTLDGANELEAGTLFAGESDGPTVDEVTGARVFALDGRELCPSCASELKGGVCKRCDAIGASAPTLLEVEHASDCTGRLIVHTLGVPAHVIDCDGRCRDANDWEWDAASKAIAAAKLEGDQ